MKYVDNSVNIIIYCAGPIKKYVAYYCEELSNMAILLFINNLEDFSHRSE